MAKKAAANTGSIRKKTVTRNGKDYTYWEARYSAGYDPGTGKQIQRSVSGKTQKEVAQKLKAAVAALDAGTYIAPNKMTVGEWLDIWQSEYLGGVKVRTVESYAGHIRNYLKPNLGALKLENLHPHIIQKFYNSLSEPTETHKILSPKTIKNIHCVLNEALKQAMRNGYLKSNPAEACVLPKIQKAEITPLDSDEISAFLDAIRGNPYERILTVILFTGLRRGEAVGLTWDCIDFQRGTIRVYRQLQKVPGHRGVFQLVTPKNSKSRTIVPAASIMAILKRQAAAQAQQKLIAGPYWQEQGFVFTRDDGRPLSPHTVYHNYKRVVTSLGIPERRLHDLRHSYAVAALLSGDDIKTVQNTLGHATAAFTLDVYGHVTDQMQRASAERMEQYIKSVSGR